MPSFRRVCAVSCLLGLIGGQLLGQGATPAPSLLAPQSPAMPGAPVARDVPARSIPVPDTVSPEMQAIIAEPPGTSWSVVPKDAAEWKARVEKVSAGVLPGLPKLREALGVTVAPTTIAGVKAFVVNPKAIAPRNRHRVLLHFHGGYRVYFPGEAGTREAILLAGFGGFRVVSVDYRMPPDWPFPAALDDAVAVYRELLKTTKARRIGVFGTSAGGSLVLTTMLRAKSEGLPMPGAIAPSTPTADLTKTGDTLFTNEFVDNSIVSRVGFVEATALLYANGRDLKDPLISPVYGDYHGFPPAILTSGTRDLYLSHTVRVHRKLRAAGVEAVLQVFEGQSHAEYNRDVNAPETKEYNEEVARFFDQHLER